MSLIRKPRWSAASLLAAIGTISVVALYSNASKCALFLRGRGSNQEDDHTIPTLLSVVDPATGLYVYALNNPLYDRLNDAVFVDHTETEEQMLESPKLKLNANTIEPRGPLTLSWTLGRNTHENSIVQDDDIILLYCDDQLDQEHVVNKDNFMDAATIAQARATSRKHTGEVHKDVKLDDATWYFPSFPIARHDVCQFYLYKALPRNRLAPLAKSNLLHIRDGKSSPTAIHLALGNDIDKMVVQFKTGNKGSKPVVKYGTQEDSMILSASGTTHSYTADSMCQSPATEEKPGKFQPPGQLHVVTLTHLVPNTTYFYKVGVDNDVDGETIGTKWTGTYSFISAPEVKADSEPFSYIVYGDQGCPSLGWGQGGVWTSSMTARETKQAVPIRAVHHFGDLSYARGAAHIWDEWLNMISSFTTTVPLMVSVGNHEYDHTDGGENGKDPSGVPSPNGYHPKWGNFGDDSGGECGVPTANHFTMPNSTTSNGVFWYSYDFANVHTTVISSEHDMSPGSTLYMWLEEDLKSVDRAKTPFLVLEIHRPLYESEIDPATCITGIGLRHRIEGLLKQYQVDLVLAGHYHSYQRTCSGLYKGKCDNGGPIHLTVGSAGASLRNGHLMPGTGWTQKFIKKVFGYGRITVANATAMHFEFIRAGAEDDPDAGKVLDEVWIVKEQAFGTDLDLAAEPM